ncbi:GUN4 domain-containing protein [Alkalinema pantanalense CENA528]|uniref:GUN4 domain-containing protein n=1 Tax=Alkalinema pantanalense TaxID=1620705 RepID=UPI003D6F4B8D
MPEEESSKYLPTTIEKVFELLDTKLVTFGVPGALSFVGITKAKEGQWVEAGWCWAGAVGILIAIKVGKKLAPKLDQLLDWAIAGVEQGLGNGWSRLRSDFEGQYLRQQARLCEEFVAEGFNPDRTAIPLLEEVFVPLDLSGAWASFDNPRDIAQLQKDAVLRSENLSIWHLLARSRKDRKFRQMSIQAKGGMGKTTLLRHVALIYGQRKYRKYRAPKLIPVLLRLRDLTEHLTQSQPPSLPKLITEVHVPSLSKNQPLQPPAQWAETLLAGRGSAPALVMFDGFDEIPEEKRPEVSRWITAQMQEYGESVFIVTSRPAGFKDYVARRPAIPIFVNKFTLKQQNDFIHRWYLCQEQCFRKEKQARHAKTVAIERAENLIQQLNQRRVELGYMAENPLLLNMLVTFHRFDPAAELPRQRLELYQGICKLQLEDRPKARLIKMLLRFEKSQGILQMVALALVKAKQFKAKREALLKFLTQQSILQEEDVDAAEFLKQIVDVSELLVEREPGEYEFPHLSFQGFFAATRLAQAQDLQVRQANAQLVLQNWNEAVWRETVLLYTAQLSPAWLDSVIRKACEMGSEAAELAGLCVREYPRPEKVSLDIAAVLNQLNVVTQDSRYAKLEELLKAGEWEAADKETYRLMITDPSVGKEEGQWFEVEDLKNFSCEALLAIDRLWVDYSQGKFGFSVQKKIWQECGSPMDYSKEWEDFGDRVGWRKDGDWLSYSDLKKNPQHSPIGNLPRFDDICDVGFFSRAETCEL